METDCDHSDGQFSLFQWNFMGFHGISWDKHMSDGTWMNYHGFIGLGWLDGMNIDGFMWDF